MHSVASYLLQVTAAAVVCGTLKMVVGTKGSTASLIRIFCAVFMAVTILRPITGIDMERCFTDFTNFDMEAQNVVDEAKLSIGKELSEDIKKRTEAYILDKAGSYGVQISAEVWVSSDTTPVPVRVRICGPVPPYAKERLSTWLRDELGIPLEEQEWGNSLREKS